MQTSPNPKKIMIKALNFDKIGLNISKINRYPTYRSSSKTSSTRVGINPTSARDSSKNTSNMQQALPQKSKLNGNIAPKSTLNLLTNKHLQISRNMRHNNTQKTNTFLSTTTNHINNCSSREKNKNTISSFTLYKNNNNSSSSRNKRNNNNLTLSNRFFTSMMNNSNSINTHSHNYRTVVKVGKNNSVLKSSLKKNKLLIRPNAVIAYSNRNISENHTIAHANANNNNNQKVRLIEKKRKFIEKEAENVFYKEQREHLKNIPLFSNNTFTKIKIFTLWKQYTSFQKRKYIKHSLKNVVNMYKNYIKSGLIHRVNQIRFLRRNILKWDKENKIINVKEINKNNIKAVFNEFTKQWIEINKCGDNSDKRNTNNNNTDSYVNKKKSYVLRTSSGALRIKKELGMISVSANASNKILNEDKIIGMFIKHIRSRLDNVIKNKINQYTFRLEYRKGDNDQQSIVLIPSKEDIANYFHSALNHVNNIKSVGEILTNIKQTEKGNDSILNQYISYINDIHYNHANKHLSSLPNEKRCKKIIFDFTLLKKQALSNAEKEIEHQLNILESKTINASNTQHFPFINNQIFKLEQIIQTYNINISKFNNRIDVIKKQLNHLIQEVNSQYTDESIIEQVEQLRLNNNSIGLIELIEFILLKEEINYSNINDILSNLSKYLGHKAKYKPVIQLYNEFINKGEKIDYSQIQLMNMKNEFDSILSSLNKDKATYLQDVNHLIQLQTLIKDVTKDKQFYQNDKIESIIKEFNTSCMVSSQRDMMLFNYIEKAINNYTYSGMFYIKFITAFLNKEFDGINSSTIAKMQLILYEIHKKKKNMLFIHKIKTHLKNNHSYKSVNTLIQKINEEIIYNNVKDNNFNIERRNSNDSSISEIDVVQIYNVSNNNKDKFYSKLFLLSKEDITYLNSTLVKSVLTLPDIIIKYFTKINTNLSLIITKNKITAIKLHINPSVSEKFVLCTPISYNVIHKKYHSSSLLLFLSSLFNCLELEIENSLTNQIIQSLSEFSSKSFSTWNSSSISQISINSLCLIFTNEVSQLLSHSKNPKKDFDLIIDKYNQWLRDKTRLNTNIILTLINHISIIEHLLKKNITDINSFEWLKFIRHLWDQSRKQVIIECGGWTNYQMKYLVPHQRVLLSPDTDKLFLFNASCFREKSASIVKIANNRHNNIEGYKNIFEEFCYLFWTEMIEINVYNTSLKEIKTIFDVATHRKSWIYFENICDLNICYNGVNELVYLSKFMQIIQQEVILNDIKSDESDKMFCLMGCVLIDNHVKFKESCLKSSSRIFNFIKPELSYYVEMLIKYCNNGIGSKSHLMKVILNNEDTIRQKLGSFYYDFDFFDNLFKQCLPKTNNSCNSLSDTVNTFIKQYSKGICGVDNENNNNGKENALIKNEKEKIKNYFLEKEIIFTNIHIDLFLYLNEYTYNDPITNSTNCNSNSNAYMNIPVIVGCGCNYFINEYINYKKNPSNIEIKEYKSKRRSKKKLIMIKNDISGINKNDYIKIFELPPPKEKKLIKCLLGKTISSKHLITITDEFHCVLLEFIQGVIECKSKNETQVDTYRNIVSIFKWAEIFLNSLRNKKINKIESLQFLSLIIQAILFVYYQNEELTSIMNELLSQLLNEEHHQVLLFPNGNFSFLILDFNTLSFKFLENEKEYIEQCITLIKEFDKMKNKNDIKIKVFFTERFTNENRELFKYSVSKCNESNVMYHIGNNEIKTLYCRIGNYYEGIPNIIHTTLTNHNLNPYEIDIINSIINKNHKPTIQDNTNTNANINSMLKLYDIIKNTMPYSSLSIYRSNQINQVYIHFIENIIFPNSTCYNEPINNLNCINLNSISNDLIIKTISETLMQIVQNQQYTKSILSRNTNKTEILTSNSNTNSFTQAMSIVISQLINDYYIIPSTIEYNEKHSSSTNCSYCNCLINSLIITQKDYQFYLSLNSSFPLTIHNMISIIIYLLQHNYKFSNQIYSVFFYNKTCTISTITEIHSLICSALVNYKLLITDQNEYINSMQFFINEFNHFYSNPKQAKTNHASSSSSSNANNNTYSITMHLLEKVHLSLSNHFLFALLLTLEQMSTNFEISQNEKEYVISYLQKHFLFPNDNSIKFNYDNNNLSSLPSFIQSNGEKLIAFYKDNTSSSIDFVELLNQSVKTTSKYFYTSNLPKIEKDTDKLLYYLTFIPEQSPSIFKYLITKYLLPLYQINKFTINAFLKTVYTRPITIKADESINITNYLCSLAAYYEIQFFIIRTLCFEKRFPNTHQYKYIIDDDVSEILRIGMEKGFWIFISDNISQISLMKMLYEIEYTRISKKTISKNFKLFLDEKLLRNECKEAIENYTLLLKIDNENVDDLEAAHDVWVNVLEEKLLTESLMDENQNDFLDMNSNDRGINNKNSMSDISFRTKHHTRTNTDLSTLFDLNILNSLP